MNCFRSTSVQWSDHCVGTLDLKYQRHLPNGESETERGSLGICSDIRSLIHLFNQCLLNTFFILGNMFLFITSGTPISHHPAHV